MCKKTGWSLFLDRDGVINEKLTGAYVKDFTEFKFKKDFLDIFPKIAPCFDYIFIVTNQQGIGKGLMTINDLEVIHNKMNEHLRALNGKIDKIYFCPHLVEENCSCRKPKPGMAHMAKKDFPAVDFKKAVLIGDSESDIEFGKSVGMKTIFINSNDDKQSALCRDAHSRVPAPNAASMLQANADYSVTDFYKIENIIERLLK